MFCWSRGGRRSNSFISSIFISPGHPLYLSLNLQYFWNIFGDIYIGYITSVYLLLDLQGSFLLFSSWNLKSTDLMVHLSNNKRFQSLIVRKYLWDPVRRLRDARVSDLSQQVTRQSTVIEFVLVEIGLESLEVLWFYSSDLKCFKM